MQINRYTLTDKSYFRIADDYNSYKHHFKNYYIYLIEIVRDARAEITLPFRKPH